MRRGALNVNGVYILKCTEENTISGKMQDRYEKGFVYYFNFFSILSCCIVVI